MATISPERKQRIGALKRADDARLRTAAIRRRIREADNVISPFEAAQLLRGVPADAARIEAGSLLLEVRKLGKVKARPILARWNVSVWEPIGDMTERQRVGIAYELEDLASRRAGNKRLPLTRTQLQILQAVADADEMGVTARDLTGYIGINALGIGGQLGSLAMRHLVTKERLTSQASLWLIAAKGRYELARPRVAWGVE